MVNKFFTLVKFGIVGILNTGIDIAVFTLLTYVGTPYLLAQCISFGSGVLNSYLLNRSWTFRREDKATKYEMGKFVFVNIITIAITSVMLVILHQYAGWSILISKCWATALGLIVNFTGSRFWVFAEYTKERRGS